MAASGGSHTTPLLLNRFTEVGNKVADAAGEVILKCFRKNFNIIDKHDFSPVTVSDQSAEEAMTAVLERKTGGGVNKTVLTMFGYKIQLMAQKALSLVLMLWRLVTNRFINRL